MLRTISATLVATMLVAPAGAGILDQTSPYASTSFNMTASTLSWQQDITVNKPGALVQIDLYVTAPGSCTVSMSAGAPWHIGLPDYSTSFSAAETGWHSIDVSASGLAFLQNGHFTLGLTGNESGLWLGGSTLVPSGGYDRGTLYLNSAIYVDGSYDVAFRTYVLPSPGAAALLVLGATVGMARWRSRTAR